VQGELRVASYNLHNLFNGDGRGGGFPTERGAKTAEDYQRQQAKLVASVQGLAPDIAVLMEVENDGSGKDSALAGFVRALNAAGPVRDYRWIDTGARRGGDSIRVAMNYRAARAKPAGRPATITDGPFAKRSRAPLAQAFRIDGKPFVVVGVHMKSKGCGREPDQATGADLDHGQGCYNPVRLASVRRLHEWLQGDPLRVGADAPVVLAGDFNAHTMEDPMRWLREQAGWRDAFARDPKMPQPYSYVFDDAVARLDHALVNDAASGLLRGAQEWHVNADETEAFDYEGKSVPGPWRASDHDPLLLGFDLE
jgi:predicted extracellular nuclease